MWDYSRFDAIDYESSDEDKEATSDEENIVPHKCLQFLNVELSSNEKSQTPIQLMMFKKQKTLLLLL